MGCDGYIFTLLEIKYLKGASLIEIVDYEIDREKVYGQNFQETEIKMLYSNNQVLDEKYNLFSSVIEKCAPIIITGLPPIKAKIYEVIYKKYFVER